MKTFKSNETNQYRFDFGTLVSIKGNWKHRYPKAKPGPTLFVGASFFGIPRKDAAILLRDNRRKY